MNTTTNNLTSTGDDAIMTSNNTAPSLTPSSYGMYYNNDTTYNETNTMYTGGRSSGYNEGSTFTFIFGIAFVLLFMIRMYQIQKRENRDNNNSTVRGRSFHGYSINSTTVGSGIRLSLEDRIELYQKTFDSNGNQLTLQNKHIVTKTMKEETTSSNNGEAAEGVEQHNNRNELFVDIELGDDNGNGNDNDDSSIYLSFESDRNNCQSNITTSTKSLCLEHDKKNSKNMISGTCVICFEDFLKDEVIVWSKDSSCNHIYHKECMVNYLAQNAQRKIASPLDITDNPCPTCRRPDYCIVSDDDLAHILSSSIPPPIIPIGTNSNEDDDDDDSDETANVVAAATITTTTRTTVPTAAVS